MKAVHSLWPRLLAQTQLKSRRYAMIWTGLLALILVLSAQMVTYSAFQTRRLVNELHVLEQQRDAMERQLLSMALQVGW